ncbi:hypothetical protein [Niastella vici]|nr:hypothetical protein [Niastella vici]
MLQFLGHKYTKHIAFLLLSTFYIDFLGQLHAAIISARTYVVSNRNKFAGLNGIPNGYNKASGADTRSGNGINKPAVVEAATEKKQKAAPKTGPTQPESSSFQSAGTDNMVDLFSGGFSYNIPLMDVGGYPVAIHYSSGITMDQEASWVGLGWNVNPGAISRTMRGLPDDFDGTDLITKTEHVKENKTVSVTGSLNTEIVGLPVLQNLLSGSLELSAGVFFNNYQGWGVETGISPSISSNIAGGKNAAGTLTGSLSLTSNSMYGVSISPSLSYSISSEDKKRSIGCGIGTSYNNRTGISSLQLHAEVKQAAKAYEKSRTTLAHTGVTGSSYISFATPSYTPTITMPYVNNAYSFTGKLGGEIWGVDLGAGVSASVQSQKLAYLTKSMPAYGYMNFTKSMADPDALMDFNREKELVFNSESTPNIGLPIYTHDIFSIAGEGIGGMFRPYRSDVGYIRDHRMQTTSGSGKLSIDIGTGGYVHAGSDLTVVDATTTNEPWKSDNNLEPKLQFSVSDTTYEPVYFKNPGEQTVTDRAFFAALGDDDLLRASLAGSGEHVSLDSKFERVRGGAYINGYLNITEPIKRKKRDKRTQLITYYTADEASNFGFTKRLLSYPENLDGQPLNINLGGDTSCMNVTRINRVDGVVRKGHHISEIDVLNNDGKKYVYGLPVYNVSQNDVSFSVNSLAKTSTTPANADKGWVQYDATDPSAANNKGKENYYSNQQTPSYAHSFLLTEILSPDYVDIRNDGVTDDDLGDAIRFNYTQVASETNPFQWRIPYTNQQFMANYNEGLKSYSRDQKGSYTFGKKELWYLNTIESKNFVAVFVTSKDRADVLNTVDSTGGLVNDGARSQRRLTRIDLYAKADLVKNGSNAKPIKSVRFDYDYSLCKGAAGDAANGKLTLKAIWFKFNGGKWKNPYKFNYTGSNPDYNPARYDRWGNYKNKTDNPASMDNYDYPYVLQNTNTGTDAGTINAQNASAWNLDEIQTPAGAKIKVTYESDDYGYVQNKRASRLFKIDGFGATATSGGNKYIYENGNEKRYVYITLPATATDINEVKALYFQGITKLFFKLNVLVPTDNWGGGNEWVPCYADIEEINFVTTGGVVDKSRIYVKVKDVDGMSPFKKVALQFLRLNLPSKAYPNSETGSDVNFTQMIGVVYSTLTQYAQMFTKFETTAQGKGWCNQVDLNKTFVRLDEPTLKRYGGGLRVKKIEMFDNWDMLTQSSMPSGKKLLPASYGQEYIYTTTENIGGKTLTISSGVASYEPQIGGDENPFRIAKELKEKTNLLAPVNLMYSEEPLGESFFPSAMVGYSKVRVRTINVNKKSTNGWSETEFYTAKEFPTLVEMTPLDGYGKKPFRSKLTEFLKIDSRQYMNVSQGFKIELNDMNGKMKSQSSFAETDPVNPINYTKYYYKVDNERADHKHLNNDVSVVAGVNGEIVSGTVGKDIEVMVDFRQQTSKTSTTNLGVNVDVVPGGPFPIPLPSAIPFPQKEIMRFRSAAVVKVINRYALLDSVVNIDKGSIVSTKSLVWDGENGQVVITRTNNEFNDPVYNLTYPAYWAYEGMAPAYTNINFNIGANVTGRKLKIIKGKLYDFDNTTAEDWEKFFRSGDEILVWRDQEEDVQAITPSAMRMSALAAPIINDDLCGEPTWRTAVNPYIKIWAIDASLGKENHQGIYFIDQEGRPYSCKDIREFRIIRSGRRNIMSASAGSIVSLADPVRNINGVNKITIDANTKVLTATAATFKNLWKVVNHWYVKDSSYMQEHDTTVTLYPKRNLLMKKISYSENHNGLPQTPNYYKSYPSNFFIASSTVQWYKKKWRSIAGRGGFFYDLRTLIDFDIKKEILKDPDFIRKNNNIYRAEMNLTHQAPLNVWVMSQEFPSCGDMKQPACIDYRFERNRWYAHDMSGELKGKDNTAILENIVTPWVSSSISTNLNTKYFTPLYQTQSKIQLTLPKTGDHSNSDITGLNCYDLVREAVYGSQSDAITGFRLRLKDDYTGDANSSERTQSYYIPTSLSVSYNNFQQVNVKLCKQFISDTVVNPYRFGILGNWRVDRNYVYYSDRDNRHENDLSSPTVAKSINLRTDGVLSTFNAFWSFTDNGMQATTDTTQWVWNSAENFFNKKGYEMENYDALGRYNSGQYGYNQQLATSATQNAKMRETFFDGFEDYNYKINTCPELCKDSRTFDGFTITSDDSHSGLYSLSLPANNNSSVTFPLTNNADTAAAVSIKVDSNLVLKETCTPKGTGLQGLYWTKDCGTGQEIVPNIDLYYPKEKGPAGMCGTGPQEYTWTGTIQAPYTDVYQFNLAVTGGRNLSYTMVVYDGRGRARLVAASGLPFGIPLQLQVGRLYKVVINVKTERSHQFGKLNWKYTDYYDLGVHASWRRSNNGTGYEIIPQQVLYPPNGDTTGTYHSLQFYCVKLNRIKPESVLLPKVAPIRGSKAVVTAWVKIKDDNTNTASTSGMAPIRVEYTGTSSSYTLQPTGVRIEGWQRYEAVTDIPQNAGSMKVLFEPGARNLLVDDIRITPFNSNMKSFVYDPVSLRLMAELDENNYSTFYEYDDEGNLMRLKKETERGIMTIKETRQHTQTTIQ